MFWQRNKDKMTDKELREIIVNLGERLTKSEEETRRQIRQTDKCWVEITLTGKT